MNKTGKGNKIYLAYGSNLNLRQMGIRCPYAVPVGPVELRDSRLLFRGHNGSAVATVEPEAGFTVPSLLWEITPRDEEALDRYEGWPSFYHKETVSVKLNGKPVDAMIYIMNDGYPLGKPGKTYLDTILEGYGAAAFQLAPLEEALNHSYTNSGGGVS